MPNLLYDNDIIKLNNLTRKRKHIAPKGETITKIVSLFIVAM